MAALSAVAFIPMVGSVLAKGSKVAVKAARATAKLSSQYVQSAVKALSYTATIGKKADAVSDVGRGLKKGLKSSVDDVVQKAATKTTKAAKTASKAADGAASASKVSKKINWEAHNVVNYAKYKKVMNTAEKANPLIESLSSTGKLPSNYITKSEAMTSGWKTGKALNHYVEGVQIGGDKFLNKDGILPNATGREWFEADIGLNNTVSRAKQPGTRLLYSNDGLLYITHDHYKTAHFIGGWK